MNSKLIFSIFILSKSVEKYFYCYPREIIQLIIMIFYEKNTIKASAGKMFSVLLRNGDIWVSGRNKFGELGTVSNQLVPCIVNF